MKETKQERKRRQGKLVRVLIPREFRSQEGTVFQTQDGDAYLRDGTTGTIRRAQPKVNGKAAKRARRKAREAAAQ